MNFIEQNLNYALGHDIVTSEKAAEDFAQALESRDPEAIKMLINHFDLVGKALRNESLPEAIYESQRGAMATKTASTAVSPAFVGIDGINNLTTPLRIDTKYTSLYQIAAGASDATEVRIYDFENTITHDELPLGKAVESKPFGTEEVSRLGIRRFGAGSVILRMLMKGQMRYTIANILRGHQLAEMRKRSDFAYAQIDTAIDTSVSAGRITSYAGSIINSINAGYQAHIEHLSGLGYQISDDVPMYLLAHGSLRPAINAAFRTIAGEDGNNVLLEYPVQPIYTWNSNILKQYDGANAASLIVPGIKNVWAEFDQPRIEQERKANVDGIDLVYQYHFNSQMDANQVRPVKLA